MDSTTLPIITAPRVVLRWISEDDVDSLYEIFSNRHVMRYWSTAPLPNREAAVALQREIVAGNESETMFKWGIALLDSNKIIGSTTLFNLSLDNGRAELGYAMAHAYWGQGRMFHTWREKSYTHSVLALVPNVDDEILRTIVEVLVRKIEQRWRGSKRPGTSERGNTRARRTTWLEAGEMSDSISTWGAGSRLIFY
jgi:Acetyltransferase (GNAT) domain